MSHEIAHIVTFAVYGERGHGPLEDGFTGCLGGNGKPLLMTPMGWIKVIPGRRSNWYLYRCPNGGGETGWAEASWGHCSGGSTAH